MNDALWFKDAVFYEVYVRAFADGNGDGHGDFRGLTNRLDYFSDLGVDCLWLLPIYPSPLLDDGYDIANYYDIHPDYGSIDDFKIFLDEAHARGLRVITDLVLNHTSDQHMWFRSARATKDSFYKDFYVWSDTDQKFKDARIIFIDSEKSNWSWDNLVKKYYWHRFYSSQPDLNYDNPRVRAEMLNVMRFWLDLGVDGFRADAIPYLFERDGTNCENLPETHAYIKEIRRFLDEQYPGRILLAEANQWPQDVRPYFGDGDEVHMAFHFPVMPRIYMALAKADHTPITDTLLETPPIPNNCQWCTFLRNHDELTLEMVTPKEREFMWQTFAARPRMRLNLGIRRRLASLLNGDRRKIELLYSILFTLPGSPILYYGDEIGMGDNIWLKDRDGVRTPMQWDAQTNAGFSSAPPDKLYAPLIDDEIYGYQIVNVAAQRANPDSLWHTLRQMIKARKKQHAFSWGDFQLLPTQDQALLAYIRSYEGENILAVHNLSEYPKHIELDLNDWRVESIDTLLPNPPAHSLSFNTFNSTLQPYEYGWLKLGKA